MTSYPLPTHFLLTSYYLPTGGAASEATAAPEHLGPEARGRVDPSLPCCGHHGIWTAASRRADLSTSDTLTQPLTLPLPLPWLCP